MPVDEMAIRIRAADPRPSGALRVYGDSFGRPYDNIHTLISATTRSNALILRFDEEEELVVTNPDNLTIEVGEFRIERADRVRWDWFSYGMPKTPANHYRQEHWLEEGSVKAVSTVDWYEPTFSPSPAHPAVELL